VAPGAPTSSCIRVLCSTAIGWFPGEQSLAGNSAGSYGRTYMVQHVRELSTTDLDAVSGGLTINLTSFVAAIDHALAVMKETFKDLKPGTYLPPSGY
jgi:hypothetical protein